MRLRGIGTTLSGDLFVAFSTANPDIGERRGQLGLPADITPCTVRMHPNLALTTLFEAAVDATEEANVNALVAAEGAEGIYRLQLKAIRFA